MSLNDFNTKEWPLPNQVPSGRIRENLVEIKTSLEQILKVKGALQVLADFSRECHEEVITVARATIDGFSCIIDAEVDCVFAYLNQIFEVKPLDGPEESAQISPGTH